MPRQAALKRNFDSAEIRYAPIVVRPRPVKARPVPSGVKLRTVSIFTMAFAVCCLIAFLAGRTVIPADAATNAAANMEEPMFKGLRTVKYDAKNLGEAKAWYSTVLGIKPYFDQPFYVGFEVGGYELGITPDESAHAKRAASGIAYWGADDANAAYKRLIDLGATPNEPVTDVGGGILIGSVHDPFGNLLGVIQNPHFKGGQ
jgi:predicted enzyme related to lactoylglutathione lyase